MNRAQRRFERAKQIRRAERVFRSLLGHLDSERAIRKRADTMKSCSCRMCGNPRKWTGEVSRQERLAAWELCADPLERAG